MTSNTWLDFINAALIGFFVGSIPTGYWIGRALKGIDIRNYGSGNLGATNVFRVLGWKAGVSTLLIDIAKGYIAVRIGSQYSGSVYMMAYPGDNFSPFQPPMWTPGICAILGHSFSPFVKFRGGKGAATGAGVFLALLPMETGIALAVFALVLAISRIVSLSSIIATMTLAIATLALANDWRQSALTTLAAVFVIIRHRANLVRLMNGTESRLSFSGKKPA